MYKQKQFALFRDKAKNRDEENARPVYIRILPKAFLTLHLKESKLENAEVVQHPYRGFCNRHLLELFLAATAVLFIMIFPTYYSYQGFLFRYAIFQVYQVLFPLILYFIVRTRFDKCSRTPVWAYALEALYPAAVVATYFILQSSSISIWTIFKIRNIVTVISILSVLIWAYHMLVQRRNCYLLFCSAAGASIALLQFKTITSIFLSVEQYYFFMPLGLAFYFVGLLTCILIAKALYKV